MSTPSPFSVQGVQLRAKNTLQSLDGELSKFKYANDFERKTGVPKTYVALGLASVTFIMIFFNLAGQLITNLVSFLYPAYASFKAMETPGLNDDKQWLTYWTVFASLQTVEYFSDMLLYWFPFYYLCKTLLVLYLALPQFRGAETLYSRVLRPYLLKSEKTIDSEIDLVKKKIHEATAAGEDPKSE